MLNFRQAILVLDGETFELKPGKINSFDQFYVDFQYEATEKHTHNWSLFLHPKQDVKISRMTVEFHLPAHTFSEITTHNWHSGLPSCRYRLDEKVTPVTGMWKGDQSFRHLPTGSGLFHSWSNIVFHGSSGDLLVGSTNESTGFTTCSYDVAQGILTIQKDLNRNGLQLGHSFPLLDFCSIAGAGSAIFEKYANMLEIPTTTVKPSWWWSTNGCASLEQVQTGIDQIMESALPVTGVLIDQGWTRTTGDWVAGQQFQVGDVAAMAQKNGLAPTLLMAPLLAGVHSKTAAQHPDWLIKESNGTPIRILSSGGEECFILDAYHTGVQDYWSGFFHIALEKWGITGFYFTDLYVACAAAPPEKTRGQAMHDTIELLQRLTNHNMVAGGEVPLGAFWGKGKILAQPTMNHITPVRHGIAMQPYRQIGLPTICRIPVLQKVKKEDAANIQFTQAILNVLFNDMVVVQGHLNDMEPEIRSELDEAALWHRAKITETKWIESGLLRLEVQHDGDNRAIYCNFTPKKKTIYENQTSIELRAYETLPF